ncbi:transcription factor 21-like [Patiria miniata]|uniref:BHLH domain-containing protein n=1 Tax=Patiria miniata TaxID=46514 RepID=A0A913ZUP8_PATMI|nr:transcription factor 21-like [Patiria miniata]
MLRLRDRPTRKQESFTDLNNNSQGKSMKEEVLCLNSPSDLTEIVLHSPGASCSRTTPQRGKACKRRGGGSGAGAGASGRRGSGARAPIKPMQRNAANARERSRMRVLSKAFGRLKTSLPWVPPDTKLSKLDTLRLASSYISHLRKILDGDTLDGTMVHPLNLTWPFAISSRPITTDDASEECDKEMRSDTTSDVMSESP